jgi:hypothetical protein
MEGTEQAKRTKWTTIRVSEETANAIKLLSERWQLSAGQVIERLLQLYDAYLESDNAAQSVVNALETLATEPAKSSPPLVEPEPATATTNDELRQVVADMLYVMEAAIDMLGTIISVYPDLRAECAPIFDRLTKRFDEVATAWNLLPAARQPRRRSSSRPSLRRQRPAARPASQAAASRGVGAGRLGEKALNSELPYPKWAFSKSLKRDRIWRGLPRGRDSVEKATAKHKRRRSERQRGGLHKAAPSARRSRRLAAAALGGGGSGARRQRRSAPGATAAKPRSMLRGF